MPDKRDLILQEMSKIYIMFCLPRITMNTKTHEIKIEYVWQNDEARRTFETLGEMLKIENLALFEQQYAQHCSQRTRASAPADRRASENHKAG